LSATPDKTYPDRYILKVHISTLASIITLQHWQLHVCEAVLSWEELHTFTVVHSGRGGG